MDIWVPGTGLVQDANNKRILQKQQAVHDVYVLKMSIDGLEREDCWKDKIQENNKKILTNYLGCY